MAKDCPPCPDCLPAYLATFADLMSLLMCFFVLLLSFATMDAVRFKKMAESMKDAFGVQREVPINEVVQGVSVIKQEFSPSTVPDPSPIDEIRQMTQEELSQLRVNAEQEGSESIENKTEDKKEDKQKDKDKEEDKKEDKTEDNKGEQTETQAVPQLELARQRILDEVKQEAMDIKDLLKNEVEQGLITVETKEANVVIRIREKGSFDSARAELNPGFLEVLDKISAAIAAMPGNVVVAGHTDNIPISNYRFRSNWDLSAARAVTVTHELLRHGDIEPSRLVVEGRADSIPLAPNDTPENRAANRRVEIVISRGQDILQGAKEGVPAKALLPKRPSRTLIPGGVPTVEEHAIPEAKPDPIPEAAPPQTNDNNSEAKKPSQPPEEVPESETKPELKFKPRTDAIPKPAPTTAPNPDTKPKLEFKPKPNLKPRLKFNTKPEVAPKPAPKLEVQPESPTSAPEPQPEFRFRSSIEGRYGMPLHPRG